MSTRSSQQDYDEAVLIYTRWITAGVIAFCLVWLLFYSATNTLKDFGAGGLILLAFVSLGALIGFLFGVPKENNAGGSANSNSGAHANTNLEQISDWLTKIIVGVGLTQLNNIPALLKKAAAFFANSFQDCTTQANSPAGTQLCTSCQSVILAIMLIGLTTGFLAGFLFTRLYLTKAFDDNDDDVNSHGAAAATDTTTAVTLPATTATAAQQTPVAAADQANSTAAPTSDAKNETTSATPEDNSLLPAQTKTQLSLSAESELAP